MSVLRGNNGPRYKHDAGESTPYEAITITKLTPIIGAEIGGVDLSKPLGNRALRPMQARQKYAGRFAYTVRDDRAFCPFEIKRDAH